MLFPSKKNSKKNGAPRRHKEKDSSNRLRGKNRVQ